MPESIELTLIVTAERRKECNGAFAIELRRENEITLLGICNGEPEAEAYAKAVARKLSSLIDAAADLLA